MDTIKKQYTAPRLTVVTFKAEQGYAASGERGSFSMLFEFDNDPYTATSTQESWCYDDQNTFGTSW